jgi:hypothetical protein
MYLTNILTHTQPVQEEDKISKSGVATAMELANDLVWVLVAGLWFFYSFRIGGAELPAPLLSILAPFPYFVWLHKFFSLTFLLMSMHAAVCSDR